MVLETSTDSAHSNRRKILLVYPEIPRGTYWSFSHALDMIDRDASLPPLGLITVAAMMPDDVEMRLVDMNVDPLRDEDLAWADAVFLSAMIVQKESCEAVVARCKASGKLLVAGGPYPSTAFAELPDADHFVIGEAEGLLHVFWNDFARGEAKRAYARPVEQRQTDVLRDHFGDDLVLVEADARPSLDETPAPRFDLLNLHRYKSMAIQTSRGCPIGCEFCDIWRRFGKKPRNKPEDSLRRELDALLAAGWRHPVFVVDDNFIGHRPKAKRLLTAMTDWQRDHGYPFTFYTEVTLTLADDTELLEGMRAAGFDMVFIGIETPSEESLRETGKLINTKGTMADRVHTIQSYGMQVAAGFILGFDNDPADIGTAMSHCIEDLAIPMAMVGLLQALPETDLHDRLEREGRLLKGASGNNTHDFSMNFRPSRPMADVVKDYKTVLQAAYPADLKSFFRRCATLRDHWRSPGLPSHTGWFEIRALGAYLLQLPLRKYRWQAAKFLATTLWKNPAFFSTAVALCVQGHHFAAITRDAFEIVKLEGYLGELAHAFADRLREHRDAVAGSDLLARLRATRDELLRAASHRAAALSRDVRHHGDRLLEEFNRELGRRIGELAGVESYLADQWNLFGERCRACWTSGAQFGHDVNDRFWSIKNEIVEDAMARMGHLSRDARAVAEARLEAFRAEMARRIAEAAELESYLADRYALWNERVREGLSASAQSGRDAIVRLQALRDELLRDVNARAASLSKETRTAAEARLEQFRHEVDRLWAEAAPQAALPGGAA